MVHYSHHMVLYDYHITLTTRYVDFWVIIDLASYSGNPRYMALCVMHMPIDISIFNLAELSHKR